MKLIDKNMKEPDFSRSKLLLIMSEPDSNKRQLSQNMKEPDFSKKRKITHLLLKTNH